MNIFNTEIQDGLNKTQNFHIYGLSRSGNHAIIFWIINNIVDSISTVGQEIYIDYHNIVCYINNVNIKNKLYQHLINTDKFSYLFKSYEDTYTNKNTSIVILRDFLNLLCSRYEKFHNNKHNICLNNQYICDLHHLIETWKQHSHSRRKLILYNDWLVSKNYRDNISKNLIGIPNIKDKIDIISEIGQGSSFNDKDYLSRYKSVHLPQHMKDIILKDKELLDLNYQLFRINMQEILKNEYNCSKI